MRDQKDLTFSILRKYPEDFPIERIARYLRLLGELVGPGGQVRLKNLSRGSVKARLTTDSGFYQEAVTRIASSARGEAPVALRRARAQLQEMVEQDRVDAKIVAAGGQSLMHLRGYAAKKQGIAGPIRQAHKVRGRIIGLEGKDQTKHVRIAEYAVKNELSGEVRDKSLLEPLKAWLFTDTVVEFSGAATLRRSEEGIWEITNFHVESVLPLSDEKFHSVVGELRKTLAKTGMSVEKIGEITKERN